MSVGSVIAALLSPNEVTPRQMVAGIFKRGSVGKGL